MQFSRPDPWFLWLGWQLARQDRELADKRLQESQESAADLCVAAPQQALTHAESQLAGISAVPPAEFPAEVLLSSVSGLEYFVVAAFTAPLGAKCNFQDLTPGHSGSAGTNQAVRAGALLGVARIQRRLKGWDAALAAHYDLSALGDTLVTGLPA